MLYYALISFMQKWPHGHLCFVLRTHFYSYNNLLRSFRYLCRDKSAQHTGKHIIFVLIFFGSRNYVHLKLSALAFAHCMISLVQSIAQNLDVKHVKIRFGWKYEYSICSLESFTAKEFRSVVASLLLIIQNYMKNQKTKKKS